MKIDSIQPRFFFPPLQDVAALFWIIFVYSMTAITVLDLREVYAADQPAGINQEDYKRAEIQIRKLVDSGEVSTEDAEKRLIEMHQMITREKKINPQETKQSNRRFSRDEYRRAELEVRRLVKNGKMSKTDAERRLSQMRQMIRNR